MSTISQCALENPIRQEGLWYILEPRAFRRLVSVHGWTAEEIDRREPFGPVPIGTSALLAHPIQPRGSSQELSTDIP